MGESVAVARLNYIGMILLGLIMMVVETRLPVKKQLICSKSLANFITYWPTLLHNVVSSTPRHEWNSNSQRSGDSH